MAKYSDTKKKVNLKLQYKIVLLVMGLVSIAFLVALILLNALPAGITLGMIAVMLALMAVSAALFCGKKKGVRIAGIVLSALFLIIFAYATIFMGNTYAMLSSISSGEQSATGAAYRKTNITEEPFNIYISGIDQWTSEKGLDLERSDVNMIMTVNPVTHKIALTSIPRDTYLALHRTGTMDKLTHTGIYGIDETLTSVSDWLGIDFDYYVKMNFNACVDIIDAIGGVEVDSPMAFKSKISEYSYTKGINHLNGKQALYYARERAAFNGEDQNRVKNQLQVVEATIHKVTSSTVLLTSYGKIMEALGEEMVTDMPTADIREIVKMQLSDMREWNIISQRMTGDYEMEVVASMSSKNTYSVLKVTPGSKRKCLETIESVMNPSEEELQAARDEKAHATLQNLVNGMFKRGENQTEEAAFAPSSSDYGTPYEKNDEYKGPLKWGESASAIEEKDNIEENNRKIIFYGGTSIRKWDALAVDMEPLPVLNHGFGGATVNDCVYYADRLIIPYEPEAIVFYAGASDIADGYSPDIVSGRTIDFFSYVHEELPDTKIYYVSQNRRPGRDEYRDEFDELNSLIKKYTNSSGFVTYINTADIFLDEYDEIVEEYFMEDGLSFSDDGYSAWKRAIKTAVEKDF